MISATVKAWGKTVGYVYWDDSMHCAIFQYDDSVIGSKLDFSPIEMPNDIKRPYYFPHLPKVTFNGLPGMLQDSLPDKFGNKVISEWLKRNGRVEASLNPVEKLCYIGTRGMGALEFYPSSGPAGNANELEVEGLVELANDILNERESLESKESDIDELIKVGTSAGGARAKAIIAWNKETGVIKSGQVNAGKGFEYYLIKFDGIENNKDKGEKDGVQYTRIEYAYYLMAISAGIEMSPCELMVKNGRYHFVTKRFDRMIDSNGDMKKLHVQSLGALTHTDYNNPGAFDYKELGDVFRTLNLGSRYFKQMFKRMVFNHVSRNLDDHVKNIDFIMDEDGVWSLSPAYDITYAYNPSNKWLSAHQMTINGKQDDIELDDILSIASDFGIKKKDAIGMIDEVQTAIRDFASFADKAGVDAKQAEKLSSTFKYFSL